MADKVDAAPDRSFDLRREEVFKWIKWVPVRPGAEDNTLDYLKDRVYVMPDPGWEAETENRFP